MKPEARCQPARLGREFVPDDVRFYSKNALHSNPTSRAARLPNVFRTPLCYTAQCAEGPGVMSDTPENSTLQPDYRSYLLRLWRIGGEAATWRGSIESPHTGERLGFGSLDDLFAYLQEQTGLIPDTEEAYSLAQHRKGGRHVSLEEMKEKIRWAGEQAWLEGNLDALDQVYAADYVWHRPPFPDTSGIEAVKQSIGEMRGAYSDIWFAYEDMIGEGSSIAYRYTMHARHTGVTPTLPIPPTNKEVTLVGCIVVNIADGKIVEEFEHSDYLGFLQQIGVIRPLG